MRVIDADELYRAKFHGVAEIIPPDEHSPESYKRGWNDAIDAIADKSCTPTIEPEPQQISCSERLPEEKGKYLVTYHPCYWGNVQTDIMVGTDSFRGKTTWAKHENQKVIAWMPLPECYRGEDHDTD